jgi:hypothetical protein
MAVDLNTVKPLRDLIPPGVYRLEIAVKRGGAGDGGWLRLAKNQRSLMLELECTVVGGDYAGKKVWDYITVEFDETDALHLSPVEPDKLEKYRTSVRMGLVKLRAIIDSAYGLEPNDDSEEAQAKRKLASYGDIHGLAFYAQIEERAGRDGYGPRNVVDFVITPDLPDYPMQEVEQFKRTLEQEMNDAIPDFDNLRR